MSDILELLGAIGIYVLIAIGIGLGVAGVAFFIGLVGFGTITLISIPVATFAPNYGEFLGVENIGQLWDNFFVSWSGFGVSFAVGLAVLIWIGFALRAMLIKFATEKIKELRSR